MHVVRYRRIVASCVLVSYLLASTLSGVMHNHGSDGNCCDAPSAACATHGCETNSKHAHEHGHHHHHHHDADVAVKAADSDEVASASLKPAGSGSPAKHLHDANCAACQFLSQHAAPVALANSAPSSDTPSPLALTVAVVLTTAAPHAFDARGPPARA